MFTNRQKIVLQVVLGYAISNIDDLNDCLDDDDDDDDDDDKEDSLQLDEKELIDLTHLIGLPCESNDAKS